MGWGPVLGPTVRLTGGLFSQLRDLFQWKETDNEKQREGKSSAD